VASRSATSPPDEDVGNLEDFDAELQRLSNANRELLDSLRAPATTERAAPPDADEIALLRMENTELRSRVEELEGMLNHPGGTEGFWADRQREYEALLEEKSEVIRALHQKIREQQERPRAEIEDDITLPPNDAALLKHQLELQQQQLREDEEAMTAQLRDMEMALSRDRAELARQRQEIQRLQADLAREIEMASRDPSLRDRLMNLRRASDRGKQPAAPPSVSTPTPVPQPAPAEAGKKNSSGIFKRFFG
jgi:hypothetical protein